MAATTTFFPEASADVTRSDNVLYSSAESASDWISRFGIVLPVRREGPRGSVGLQYSPSLFRYRDNSDLDHARTPRGPRRSLRRPSSTLAFGAGWERSQTQGTTGGLSTSEPFVVPRSEREHYRGEVTYERQSGERWRWNTALRGDRTGLHADIGIPSRVLPGPAREPDGLGGHARRPPRDFPGRGVRRRVPFPEVPARRDRRRGRAPPGSHDGRRGRPRRDASALRLGAFHRKPQVAAGGAATDTGQANGVQGGLQVERRFRRNALRFEAEHGPSSGGGLQRDIDRQLGGAVAHRGEGAPVAVGRRPRVTRGAVRAWPGRPRSTTSGGAASAAWFFGEKWAFTLGARIREAVGERRRHPRNVLQDVHGRADLVSARARETGRGRRRMTPTAKFTQVFEVADRVFLSWWIVVAGRRLGLAGGVVALHYLPKTYEASTTIFVAPQQIPQEFVRSTITDDMSIRLGSLREAMLSRPYLSKLIEQTFGKTQNAEDLERLIQTMRSRIEVKVIENASGGARPVRRRLSPHLQGPRAGARGECRQYPRGFLHRSERPFPLGAGGWDHAHPSEPVGGRPLAAPAAGARGGGLQGAAPVRNPGALRRQRPAPPGSPAGPGRRSSGTSARLRTGCRR